MNVQLFITKTEKEIDELVEGAYYAKNSTVIKVIGNAIQARKDTIEKLKDKYSL